MKDEAGMGGVVVGDEDDGTIGFGVAEFADDVVGAALGQQAPHRPAVRREVSGNHRDAEGSEDCSGKAPAGCRGQPAEHAGGGPDADRPPVGAVRGLGLDAGVRSEFLEAGLDPFGGLELSGGRRRALDPLQFFEARPEPLLVRVADSLHLVLIV